MKILAEDIKRLREETSCGVMECKNALQEAQGDAARAKGILRQRGLEMAAKKGSRLAKEGRVESYLHLGNKIGVLLEVNCETDFAARSEDYIVFCKNVAMHIAAMAPTYIRIEDVPQEIMQKVSDPKIFAQERCLMDQPFVKDLKLTIQDLLNSLIAKIGENIFVGRFIRYKVGVSD